MGKKIMGEDIDGKILMGKVSALCLSRSTVHFFYFPKLLVSTEIFDQVESQKQLETLSQRCQTVIACRSDEIQDFTT